MAIPPIPKSGPMPSARWDSMSLARRKAFLIRRIQGMPNKLPGKLTSIYLSSRVQIEHLGFVDAAKVVEGPFGVNDRGPASLIQVLKRKIYIGVSLNLERWNVCMPPGDHVNVRVYATGKGNFQLGMVYEKTFWVPKTVNDSPVKP